MMASKWHGKFPFDPKTGSMPDWVNPFKVESLCPDYEWRDPEPMEMELHYDHISRGRSSVVFWFRFAERDNTRYPIGAQAFHLMVPYMRNGAVIGVWKPAKRGQNFRLSVLAVQNAAGNLIDPLTMEAYDGLR